jgi:hypothetical protein
MSLQPSFCAGYLHKANSALMMLLLYQIDHHVKLYLQLLFFEFLLQRKYDVMIHLDTGSMQMV